MPELDPTRRQRLTASILYILASGDRRLIQNLLLTLWGDPRAEPITDLTPDSWLSVYGLMVERLALDWYGKQNDLIIMDRGVQVFHPERDFLSATLDARIIKRGDNNVNHVVDVKTLNAFMDTDAALAKWTPQVVCQVECAGADAGSILLVKGGAEPVEVPIYYDQNYRDELFALIDKFWHHVETLTTPFEFEFPQIVPPSKWKSVDLDVEGEQPNWRGDMIDALTLWDLTKDQAEAHDDAKRVIKNLLPDDVGKVRHGGLIIARAKNNAVSIRRAKGDQ